MSTTDAPTTTSNNNGWVPVATAAARLDISERQARRHAGKLKPEDKREPDTEKGTPTLVRLEAMRERLQEVRANQSRTSGNGHMPDMSFVHVQLEAGREPDVTPDTIEQGAGHRPDADLSVKSENVGHEPDTRPAQAGHEVAVAPDMSRTPDAGHGPDVEKEALRDALAREREFSTFLKSQLEESNRNAAELRAALRKALEIAPRQLVQGTPDTERVEAGQVATAPQQAESPQNAPPTAPSNNVPNHVQEVPQVPPNATKQPPKRGEALAKIREGLFGLFTSHNAK